MQALRRKIRFDQGGHPALSSKVRELLATQYRQASYRRASIWCVGQAGSAFPRIGSEFVLDL